MKLSIKSLDNVSSENHWEYASSINVQEGQVNEFYVQLVDLSKQIKINDTTWPLRYIPTSPSLTATFPSLDDAGSFDITATSPFSDKSIFKFTLTSSQTPKSGSIEFLLVDNAIEKRFIVTSILVVDLLNIGSC
jgi:hypothetical protein